MPYRQHVRKGRLESYKVYQVLRGLSDDKDGLTTKELEVRTRLSKRAVIEQRKLLIRSGVVVGYPPPRGSDRRTRSLYRIGPGWTYREIHERVLQQVSAAVSSRQVCYPESAGYILSRGPNEPLVYVDLLFPVEPKQANSYRPGPSDSTAYRNRRDSVFSAIRQTLADYPDQWDDLLRRAVVEVVSSQPQPFFLLSYPHQSLQTGRWPDSSWMNDRDRTVNIPTRHLPKFHTWVPFPRYGRSAGPILRPSERLVAQRWAPIGPEGSPYANFYAQLESDHRQSKHDEIGCCDCFHRVLREKERRGYLPRVGSWKEPRLTSAERRWAARRNLLSELQSIHTREAHATNGRCRCHTVVRVDREGQGSVKKWSVIASEKGGTPLPHWQACE